MDRFIEQLADWGCDTAGALARMEGDATFYRDCLREFAADPQFDALGTALAAKQPKQAFFAAHTLKGVALNLGLTPMLTSLLPLTEILRKSTLAETAPLYAAVTEARTRLIGLL